MGWVALITFVAIYAVVPWLWRRERMYSPALIEIHFWLALAGTLIYVFAMWNSGIIQGLMWRTYNDSGTLTYSFLDSMIAMHPYYVARAIGGLLFLIGAIVGCYNIWRSEEHTSELQSLMRLSYAVLCLKKKQLQPTHTPHNL